MKYNSKKEILEKVDAVAIINSYLDKPLVRSGSSYMGLCPFHVHEKNTPSMNVYPDTKSYYCFGKCQEGGDIFNFVSKISGISYNEAIKVVANKCGMDYEYSSFNQNKYDKEYEVMNYSLKFYQNNLVTSEGIKASEYLENRGINRDVINNFHFGLSFNDDGLKKYLENKKIDLDMAVNLGLLLKSGIEYHDMFKDRIMIPIFNNDGNLCGYTGRCYLKDEDSKYINTKKTTIYDKSEIIFNFYNAKKSINLKKSLIIVEGNMDAISLASKGITNVCALMGVAISESQIKTIKRLNTRVILMLDSDEAGEKNTERIGDELYKNGIDLKVVRLENAKDPDEYINKFGLEALENVLDKPMNYLDYKLNKLKLMYDLNSIEDKGRFVQSVKEFVRYSPKSMQEMVYTSLSEELKLPISLFIPNTNLNNKINNINTSYNYYDYDMYLNEYNGINVKVERKSKYDLAVSKLIYLMLKDKDYYSIYMDKLGYLKRKVERDVITFIGGYIKKTGDINIDGFIDYIIKYDEIVEYVNKIISENEQENIAELNFYDILDTAIKCINEEEIKELMGKIKKQTDVNEKIRLIEKLTELKKGSGNNEGN